MKKILLLIFLIILFASGYYYYNKNNGEISTTTYEFIKIEKGNIKKIVSATGKIIPTSSQILSSEISGKIVRIEKDFNQIVKQGDTLAVFDQNPFLLKVQAMEIEVDISNSKLKQKKSSYEKATSELNNSISNKIGSEAKLNDFKLFIQKLKKDLDNQDILFKKKIISKYEYEDSKLEYDRALYQLNTLESDILSLDAIIDSRKAQLKIIEAEIEEVKTVIEQSKLNLEREKLDLTKTKIISPIDGFILDRHISVGDVLGAYQKDSIMFTIAKTLSKMNIEIFIDESDIGNIKPNQLVEFSTDAFPNRKLNANITQIHYSPVDDQNVITYEVLALFDNPDNLLLPGMTANVDIIVEEKKDILKVKNSALSVKINQNLKKEKNQESRGRGGQSQMREIMSKLNMTKEQQNKMRSVYPQLGKIRESLSTKNLSQDKIAKEMSLFIENSLIEILSDEQTSKYFSLKESLNLKKLYKIIDNKPTKIELITGLTAGGYTEIIQGDVKEDDEVISKVSIKKSEKKALRLF
jgi:HlyD family secretion protein